MSNESTSWSEQRSRIIGLGEGSARKSYYAELQKNIEELKASEADLRTIFNSTHDAILIHDFEGRILDVNESMLRIYRITREEALVHTIADYSGEQDRIHRLRSILEAQRSTGADQVFEWQARRPSDKSLFPVEVAMRTALWRGRPMVVTLVRDITERHEAELEHHRLEEQLSQLRKLETIGQLAGGVAHDFNNMLTPIMNYAIMLRDDFPTMDPRRADLEEIIQSALRARDLTRQLLAFARQQKMALKRVNLNQVIQGFKRMLCHTLRDDIVVEFSLADCLEWMDGDVGQIEQVVLNLGINAQDAMPNGGVLRIQTSNRIFAANHGTIPAGHYACLAITDHGMGMDEDTKKRIFEPFFTTKALGRGTGLGLSTVFGIVHQHKAFIEVESQLGAGTTFSLYFPGKDAPVLTEELMPKLENGEPSGSGTILLVEDQEKVRNSTKAVFERRGYLVLAAKNGAGALELASHYPGKIDLLVSDVIMDGMNGKELLSQLSCRIPTLKSLFISGYPDEVISRHGVLDPSINFLPKPFAPDELIRRCAEIIKQSGRADTG